MTKRIYQDTLQKMTNLEHSTKKRQRFIYYSSLESIVQGEYTGD